jgi:hypothetical protein
MMNTCSCLNLILPCIVYWKACEISRGRSECDPLANRIDLCLLEHVSPIEGDNVVLYGQYILDRPQHDIATVGHNFMAVMTLIAERTQKLTRASGAAIQLIERDELVYRVGRLTHRSSANKRFAEAALPVQSAWQFTKTRNQSVKAV